MFQGNRIGDVMVSLLASRVVDRGFEPISGQTKNYKIGICCFPAKHAALRRKSKDLLAWNQWFFQGPPFSSTNKTDRHDITEILLKVALNIIKQTYSENKSWPQGGSALMGFTVYIFTVHKSTLLVYGVKYLPF